MLAHEIRNPISAIIGASTLIKSGVLENDSREECIDLVDRSAKNLNQLLTDILELSVCEVGKQHLNLTNQSIKKLIEDVLIGQGLRASEKNLRLSCSFTDDIPGMMMIDQNKLSQVVINLVLSDN